MNCYGQEHGGNAPTLVLERSENNWIDGYFSPVSISPTARQVLFGGDPNDLHLYDMATDRDEPALLKRDLTQLTDATFCGSDSLARLGQVGNESGWFFPWENGQKLAAIQSFISLVAQQNSAADASVGMEFLRSRNQVAHLDASYP